MFLAQGPQRSDAGEAPTRGVSVPSQALTLCGEQLLSRLGIEELLVRVSGLAELCP